MLQPPQNPFMPPGPSIPFTNGTQVPLVTATQAPPPVPSPEEIRAMVDQQEQDTQPLRKRMEDDYSLYRLDTHVNLDKDGEKLLGYAVYTSSAPRAFADKVMSWASMAKLLLRAPHLSAAEHEETLDNAKERFAIGCLKAADERLLRMLQPTLASQQAFFVTVRGGYLGGRCLLAKRPDGKTYVDITAWDPLHLTWGVGADGLEWVCYKTKKTRGQIKREYGVDLAGGVGQNGAGAYHGSSDAEKEGVFVYDYYDGQINTVLAEDMVLKAPTPHGSPRVPCYLVPIGSVPLLQPGMSGSGQNLMADVGESVYGAARDIYMKWNDILSIMLHLVRRARRQPIVAESRDGSKTLPEDPLEEGSSPISLATGEKIYTLEMQKVAQETGAFLGLVSGEMQRATLPFSAYGELQFQLSGFAITQLRQGIETVLYTRIEALTQMYLQIANLLYDQFMTGAFDGFKLSGRDNAREYFSQAMTPEMIANTCDYTVELVPTLPQDDMAKWGMAQIAKALGFLADVDILDNILGIQDSQQAIDKARAEKAEQGLPEAVLYSLGMAAANRGDKVVSDMYLLAYQMLMAQKLGMLPPQPPAGGQNGGGPNRQLPTSNPQGGQRPEVFPTAATGAPPPTPTPQSGPNVPPNSPRPGAQEQ